LTTMADVASPTTPIEAGTKKDNVKPEKPDEEVYKAALKKAEKEHADSMTKFVSGPLTRAHARLHCQ
jgi:hypothetical protein